MARTKSAATSLGPPIKVLPPAAAGKKAAAPGTKVVGAKRTALGGVVTNVNIKEEALEDKKPGKYSSPKGLLRLDLTIQRSRQRPVNP
jgi:hypothetical protein